MTKIIILIGKTGSGKSTLANVISGTDEFIESESSISVTKEIKKGKEFSDGSISYAVIDTVGIGDTQLKKEEVLDKIAEAVYLARNGISQVLFVTNGRFDQFEMSIYGLLSTIIFDKSVTNYTTIVRTKFPEFEKEKERQKDIEEMITSEGELSNVIKTCQQRVVHIDNPSLDIDAADDESDDEREEREELINLRKKIRSKSQRKVLEHLQEICLKQEKDYKPQKLQELSDEIFEYMQTKIESKSKLVKKYEERKKLEEIKKAGKKSLAVEDEENESENISLVGNMKVDKIKSLVGKEGQKSNNNDQKLEVNKKVFTKLRIGALESELRELVETKKLIEDIQKAEGVIRQKVLNHIFHSYNEITQVVGGEVFLSSITEDNNNSLNISKLSLAELQKQKDQLEKKLSEKGSNDQSLDEIKSKIKQTEQVLLDLKKELLTVKEILEGWQKQGFSVWQAQKWADALGKSFNPENDVPFCTWLRDSKELTTEEVLDYDIEQLRIEHDPQKSDKTSETRKILLIGKSGCGKSTLANVLLNKNGNFEEVFGEHAKSVGETRKVQFEQFEDEENNINYTVIDTPGFGDDKLKDNQALDTIAEVVYLVKDSLSQVFFVTDGRLDQYEAATYNLLRTIIFDENITKHTTIIRTHFGDFKDKKKCQSDISSMVEKVTELREIIESYGKRVIHVDNPAINTVMVDNEGEREVKFRKDARSESRKKILSHLATCEDIYQSSKLQKLNTEIAEDYLQYLKKKEKLAGGLNKLKTSEPISIETQLAKIGNKSVNSSPEMSSKNKSLIVEGKKESLEWEKQLIIARKKKKGEIPWENWETKEGLENWIKELEEKKVRHNIILRNLSYEFQVNQEQSRTNRLSHCTQCNKKSNFYHFIWDKRTNKLERSYGNATDSKNQWVFCNQNCFNGWYKKWRFFFEEELKDFTWLKRETEEKERVIRCKILKHIFNSCYKEIGNELWNDIFLVVGEHDWGEINQEFTNKELVLKWLMEGFAYQQVQEWAVILGGGFNPNDVGFCVWLRDTKCLTTEQVLNNYDLSELRGEYNQYQTQTEIPPK